jgi:hypothetical protein
MASEAGDAYENDDFANVPLGLCRPYIVEKGTTLPGRSRYLLMFRHRYLDFRLAESQALAEIAYGKKSVMRCLLFKKISPPSSFYIHIRN